MHRLRSLGISFTACLLLAWVPGHASVVITELMYHPASDVDGDEFIELLNTDIAAINVGGWCLAGVTLCFPPATMIPAGERLVLAHDATRFAATYGFAPDHAYTARLDNSGERLALLDGASQLVDEVTYADLPPWPVTPDGLGPSLELVDPAQDNDTPRNWRASTDVAGHTAGAVNSVDATGLPPWIQQAQHTVDPEPFVPLVVTAQVLDATSVELHYRIDFAAEVALAMLDDGANQDGAAGDGLYGAQIAGQLEGTLIRYRITATGSTGSMGFPRDDDTVTYDGTVVADPSVNSNLPVFWWFMEPADYQASLDHRYTDQLEPAVFYYDGRLIDAIEVRVRGQSARNYAKKHWKFHMPHGHDFFDAQFVPVSLDQFNLQGAYSDKTYLRERLSYDTFLETGSPAPITRSIRLQQNGTFFGLYTFLQAMDDDYLTTNRLDTQGAWYKAFDDCRFRTLANLPARYEKKTRLDEGHEDLFALLDGVNNLSGQTRRDFLFDNVDLARMANYLATTVAIHNTDFPHKNYFIYRDTEGNGRWYMHPWDMDLTFGRNWQGTVLNDEIWADRDTIAGRPVAVSPSHPLVGEAEHQNWDTRWNRWIDALYEEPEFREMYYRRLRTLLDWILADGRYEARIDAMIAPIAAEAALDAAKWGQYGQAQTIDQAATILKNDYLLVRRTHLGVTHRGAGELPDAQSDSPPIVINEIMYDPSAGPDHEFIELYNPSATESVDLSGYRLDGVALTLPPGTVILPDDYLVVARNDPAFRLQYGSGRFVAAQYGGALDNAGESVILRDPEGRLVARVDFSAGLPWPVAAAGGGSSLELIDPTGDNGWVANWAPSAAPGGTPGAPNSAAGSVAAHPGIYINEVLPLNGSINTDEGGDFHSWVELYNANAGTVDLGGMTMTPYHTQPDAWEIPAGTLLCGGCYVLVWADVEPLEGPLHSTFQLGFFGGTVGLYDASGSIVDYVDYGLLASDTSFGRYPDGRPDLRTFLSVTPAAANVPTLTPLLLNEYNAVNPTEFLENDGSDVFWGRVEGNGGDWFELVVTQDHLDIRGWQLLLTNETGAPGETQQVLVFSSDPLWADLRSGTLITISEDLPDAPGVDPVAGDWWINVQAADSGTGAFITAQDFTVTNDAWQLTILDDLGQTIFGPAGEGVVPVAGIGGDEVYKLEQDPGPFVTRFSSYNDGSSSTFGAPNVFAAGTVEQSFAMLRCDGQVCVSLDGTCGVGSCDTGSGSCGAVAINEGLTCDDGNPCSSGDTCVAAACTGTLPDCSHLDDACNVGSCNPQTTLCQAQPINEGLACEDGNVCTTDSCAVGVCASVPSGVCELNGVVLYYRNGGGGEPGVSPVPDVDIDLDGDLLADATTGVDGAYTVPSLAGMLVVSPLERVGGANGAVSSLDASYIAQHVVQQIELSQNQQIAADVTGNGAITSFDAAQVSQYAVQLIGQFPVAISVASDWAFFRCDHYIDENAQDCATPLYVHDPLVSTETGNFYAMLYGDVTGNWSDPGAARSWSAGIEERIALADRKTAARLAGAGVTLRPLDSAVGTLPAATAFFTRELERSASSGVPLRRIAIAVEEGASIQAFDLELRYDPRLVTVHGIETTGPTREYQLVTHDSDGVFRAASWGLLPIGRSGDVFVLTLEDRSPRNGPLRLEILANEQPFEVRFDSPKQAFPRQPPPAEERRPR